MFGSNNNKANGGNKGDYRQVSLGDFSDDDSDHDDLTPPSRHHGTHSTSKNNYSHNIHNNNNHNGGGGNNNHDEASESLGRQQELLRKQDEGLEMLSQSAERLGQMSLQINDEIGFQNKMLDEMETDLEKADENLDMVTRQTKKFIEEAGGTKSFIIILSLGLVVVVLLILLIYF